MSYRYTYVGAAPTVFPDLTGVRKAQGLPAEIEPGETIDVPKPVLSKQLVPADAKSERASIDLLESEPELSDAEQAALGATAPSRSRGGRRTRVPKPRTGDESKSEPELSDAEQAALGATADAVKED